MTNEQLEKLSSLAKDIKINEDLLARAEQRYSDLTCGGRQKSCQIVLGSITVEVTGIVDRTYESKMIRGRDMLYLGVQKILAAQVEHYKDVIKNLRSQCYEVAKEQP